MYPDADSSTDGLPGRRALGSVAILFLVGCVSIGSPTAHSQVGGNGAALAHVAADGGAFTLTVSACDSAECPLQVVWTRDDGARTAATLDLSVSAQDVALAAEEPWPGVAGVLAGSAQVPGIATGEEYSAVATSLEAMTTANGLPAVLIRQRVGFEHLKHHFYVFIVSEDRLERVWSAKEGNGPYRSDVAVLSAPGNRDMMVHIVGFAGSQAGQADTLSVSQLDWAKGGLEPRVLTGIELPMVRLAPDYASIEGAIAAMAQANTHSGGCLSGYWVLGGERVDAAAPSRFVLAAPAASDALVQAEVGRLETCLKGSGADFNVRAARLLPN